MTMGTSRRFEVIKRFDAIAATVDERITLSFLQTMPRRCRPEPPAFDSFSVTGALQDTERVWCGDTHRLGMLERRVAKRLAVLAVLGALIVVKDAFNDTLYLLPADVAAYAARGTTLPRRKHDDDNDGDSAD